MWLTLKARIRGLFTEYKSNPSLIHGLLGLLVQVAEGKLFRFLIFALLSVLSHECPRAQAVGALEPTFKVELPQ